MLAVAGAVVPTYASAPGWSDESNVGTGYTESHGVILDPNDQKYICAADGGSLSAVAPFVTSTDVSRTKPMNSLRVATFVGHYYQQLGGARVYGITDTTIPGRIAWVTSNAKTSDGMRAAAYQIGLIRVAGTFEYGVYQLQEQGKLADGNTQLGNVVQMSKNVFVRAVEGTGPYNVAPKLELAKSSSEGSITNIDTATQNSKQVSGYSYTLQLSSPTIFEPNQSKSPSGTTSQSARNVKVKTTGADEASVKLVVKGLPTAKPQVTAGNVTSHSKTVRGQNLVVLGKKAPIEGTMKANRGNTEFAPSISMQVKAKKVARGSGLVDMMTVKTDNQAKIPRSDKHVPVKATADVYGPFNSPVAQTNDDKAFAGKKIGSYDVTLSGPGTLNTVGTVKAPSEGFYFFQARAEKSTRGQYKKYVKNYTSPLFETSETTVAPWTPSIKTETSQVDLGGSKVDVQDFVNVSGFPEDHGPFQGAGDWKVDSKTVSHSIYFFPEGTKITEGATKNTEPFGTVETPAKNGTCTIDVSKFAVDWNLGVGTYVIVPIYQGDSRSSAIRTSGLDTNEHVKPTFGRVTTVASTENGGKQLVAGDKIRDNVKLGGSFPSGACAEVKLYSWSKDRAPKCGSAIWTPRRIEHLDKAGEYKTDYYTTDADAQVTCGFVETTYDKNGKVLSAGKCGGSSETPISVVGRPGRPDKPTTPAPAPVLTPKTTPRLNRPEFANTGAAILGLGVVAGGLLLADVTAIVIHRRHKDT